jgi:hypothetical protein
MPPPRIRLPNLPARVPERVVRQVFKRLREEGSLEVVLSVLRDHLDTLARRVQGALGAELLVDVHQLARFQARQGALDEVGRIISTLEALAEEEPQTEGRRRTPGET